MKIGLSGDPEKRLRSMQSGSPVPLVLLHTEAGDFEREMELHHRFDLYRVRGEWFYPGVVLSEYCGAVRGDPDVDDLIEKALRLGISAGRHAPFELPEVPLRS